MTRGEAQLLGHGLYRIFWNDGGCSLASVGSSPSGQRWMAPTNWVNFSVTDTRAMTHNWQEVKRVELIELSAWMKS